MAKVYIKTYGCQMNERDSEAVASLLKQRGHEITEVEHDADVVLLNTCSVRDQAEHKAIGKMGLLAHELKKTKPKVVLGFMGCMAQSRGAELLKQKGVDLVVGTQKFHRVPDYVDELLKRKELEASESSLFSRGASRFQGIVDVAEEAGSESTIREHLHPDQEVTSFISIMQGCNQYCTFCIVPYTRGQERSRSIAEIVDEARQLVERGVKEITLLGQIVTSYGKREIGIKNGKTPFVQLLEALHEVKGLHRIRFTSPHPKGITEDLIEAYCELPLLCESLHLPVQSGSNRILKAMHRGYTVEKYKKIIDDLKSKCPEIALTTDIIVGFPGETDEDFVATVDLVRYVQYDNAFIFRYSKRKNTPAAEMPDQLSDQVKEERNQILLGEIDDCAIRINNLLVGRALEILVEGPSKTNPAKMYGRTRGNKIVIFDGDQRHRGQIMNVRIEKALPFTLYGDPAILD